MIESEERRKELAEEITQWVNYTKVAQYLRPDDIPHLVSRIIETFYHTRFSCGHYGHWNEGVHIAFKDTDNGKPCTVSGLYCKDCAEDYKVKLGAWEVKDAEQSEVQT